MVVVNCGALAEGVLESELFGHERGAFTGAVARKRGKVELAHEGTLFLDEIGDVSTRVQVDLLRVLQERTLTRVGGSAPVRVDFRLITATHRDLAAELAAGRLREDFYFRINVLAIHLPPLRERPADILPLASCFLARFSGQMGKRIEGFTAEASAALTGHPWPGNVRELQNTVERAVVLCRGSQVAVEHLPFAPPATRDLSLSSIEESHIRRVLAGSAHNVTQAAKLLGIDRVTLYNKMKKYGIERP
jgi:transcriptional regulator with PAS, ATPase and Fis domain